MLEFILFLFLAAQIGNAYPNPDDRNRLLARQNNSTALPSRPLTTATSRPLTTITTPPLSTTNRPLSTTSPSSSAGARPSSTSPVSGSCVSGLATCGPKLPSTLSGQTPSTGRAPSTTRPAPSSYPTVNEDSAVPKGAEAVTTAYGPITATLDSGPVTLVYSGEAIPLQTVANHKPVSNSFKDAVLVALAKDPDTRAFGDLLSQTMSAFDALEQDKEYYVFAPTTQFVVDFLLHMKDNPQRLALRDVLIPPRFSLQFCEKPKDANIEGGPITLKTALVGEIKYVNLGPGEAARVVSNPRGDGTVQIFSGPGDPTLVHAGETPFEGGVIMKSDGFFTLPRVLETAFANTSGRLWSTSLEKANLLKELSGKQRVTIFAVQDSSLDPGKLPKAADLKRLIYDGLAHTPELGDDRCLSTGDGGTLHFTRNGGDIFANGARISAPNVIAKNGVIHYLEKVPPAAKCTPPDGGKGKPNSASSMAGASMMAVLGVSVATLSVYLCI